MVTYLLCKGIHTNFIESFWAIVKCGIYGIYHHVSVPYMQEYINFCFCLNYREQNPVFNKLVELAVA